VNITTPANFFHALRRQMKRDFLKPLVVMSPKSLLRLPAATSRLEDFTTGSFKEIIDDPVFATTGSGTKAPFATATKAPARVVFCSGKVYYDLVDYREKNGHADTAIVRLEQLYPLHVKRLAEIAKKYSGARIVWCQEESQNMGAWSYIAPLLTQTFNGFVPIYAGRDASASPAVGSLALHKHELGTFLKEAFTL
jgi:2-oxoglutarate dehydrogenase E1 component